MQTFTLQRGTTENTTTAIDQSMMRVFKDRDALVEAVDAGLLNEGEIVSTIDDDTGSENLQDEVRQLQEDVRELQESTTGITDLLPGDVSSDNLLETVQGVLTAIQALDTPSVGGDGKYVKSVSETDGIIQATAGNIDNTVTANSINPVTSGAVYTKVNEENTRATTAESALSDRLDILEVDPTTQTAVDAVDAKFKSTVTSSDQAIPESEIDNKISTLETSLDNRLDTIESDYLTSSDMSAEVSARNSAISTAVSNAINALDKADTAQANKYVSAVSETNGIITVTRGNLPTFSYNSSTGVLTITA